MNDETPEAALSETPSAAETEVSQESAERLDRILEALLLSADGPLSLDQLQRLLAEDLGLSRKDLRDSLARLDTQMSDRSLELREVASGYRLQVRNEYAGWVSRLWQEKPPRFSRALLETLALICYRQPITRGEIEEVRGVAVSSNIIRTLQERGWVREVGVKEVPGRPVLFGTTHQFLDDFNIKSLDQLPDLPDIRDVEQLEAALSGLEAAAANEADEAEGETDAAPSEADDPQALVAEPASSGPAAESNGHTQAGNAEDAPLEAEPDAGAEPSPVSRLPSPE